jgi:hypothetical protein
MISVFVNCDEAIAQELSEWCWNNLDFFYGYGETPEGGYKFYFDDAKDAKTFELALGDLI